MEPSPCRVRPYSAKSVLILMMMAGFRNVSVHCNNVFSFLVRLGREKKLNCPFNTAPCFLAGTGQRVSLFQ